MLSSGETQPVVSEVVERLRRVTEADAYASPWTFGETCREAAALILSLEGELEEVKRIAQVRLRSQEAAVGRHCATLAELEEAEARATRAETLLAGLEGSAREPAQSASGAHALGEARHADEVARLRSVLERIANRAQSEVWPDHYAAEPPEWATDPFNDDDASTCGYCGAWLTVVRPGKSQCDCCSDGRDLGAIARAALARPEPLTVPEASAQANGSFVLGDTWPDWFAVLHIHNIVVTGNLDGRTFGGPDYAEIKRPDGSVLVAKRGHTIRPSDFFAPMPGAQQ